MAASSIVGGAPTFPHSISSLSSSSSSSSSPSSVNLICFSISSQPCIKLNISFTAPPTIPLHSTPTLNFKLHSTVEQLAVAEPQEEEEKKKKKLFVVNLPWNLSVTDMKTLFGECGTVKDVEIIKAKDGKHKGFAFITMDTADEAQAVMEKFDSHELSGRIIRVEFAKRLKKPSPPPPVGTPAVETRHKLYVSNLAWKARASHLREFFSAEFNPVSARVVFGGPSGGSAGYGFVSFSTKEEAEAAISSLDGKELMGRPIGLKLSEKNVDGSGDELVEDTISEDESKEAEDKLSQPEET